MISRHFVSTLLALALAVGVWGRDSQTAPSSSASDQTASAGTDKTAADANPDYTLLPSDLLRVQIFQEDDLNREVRITQESSITLPLIGLVDLHGKTLRQTQELIRTLYDRDFLVNPQVNITVLEYSKRTVNVLGSVNQPGAISFPPEQGMTLLDAISRAGGFNRLANKKNVTLTRNVDGKSVNYVIDTESIIDGSAKDNWPLQKDDLINVRERVL